MTKNILLLVVGIFAVKFLFSIPSYLAFAREESRVGRSPWRTWISVGLGVSWLLIAVWSVFLESRLAAVWLVCGFLLLGIEDDRQKVTRLRRLEEARDAEKESS